MGNTQRNRQSLYRLRDSGKFEKLSVKLDKAKAEETIAKLDLDNLNTPSRPF